MNDSAAFAELFPAVYMQFCRRLEAGEYRPSMEAAAILEHLSATGPLTVTEAAQHFGRSQSATSELIDRLRERGLVDRIQDERDQRRHLIWLTEEGRRVVLESRRVLDPDLLGRAFARLPDEESRNLIAGMRALLDAARNTEKG